MSPIRRLGAVPYLNAKPLVLPLQGAAGLQVGFDLPSRLGPSMAAGSLDAALIPVFELAGRPAWRAVDGVAIASDGPVQSVLLYCRRSPKGIRTLVPDAASRTSNALVQVLLAEQYGVRPALLAPEADAEGDAVLRIGDAALKGLPGSWETVLDLGASWQALTGLPFVYAVWATPLPPAEARPLADRLRAARAEGTADLAAVAAACAPGSGFEASRVESYLRDAIRYDLGDRERRGLIRYLEGARRLGLASGSGEVSWI